MNEQIKPRQASTVILLREAEAKGFEVFLTRRPEGMPFLGGMYCFPGGAVIKDDGSPRMLERCRGLTPEQARKIIGAHFNPRRAASFWVAAVRELFEETGILLARQASDQQYPRRAIEKKHRAVLDRSMSFVGLLQNEGSYCDLANLFYFSHWQTPAQNSIRFDTRFFVAALPCEQTPLKTSAEVVHSLWLSPDRALQRHSHGELPMIFPTYASLRTLADFESLGSVIKEFGDRQA